MIEVSSFGICCKTLNDFVIYSCTIELSSNIDDLKLIDKVSQKLLLMYSMCDLMGATFTTKQSIRSSELKERKSIKYREQFLMNSILTFVF